MITGRVKQPSPEQELLPGFGTQDDAPLFDENNDASEIVSGKSGNQQNQKPQDLCVLYRKMAPKGHLETILVICYYYQMHKGHESVSYDDCSAAYMELLRVGVTEPVNPRQFVKDAVDRKHLYKPDRAEGKFALTDLGIEFVEQLGARA